MTVGSSSIRSSPMDSPHSLHRPKLPVVSIVAHASMTADLDVRKEDRILDYCAAIDERRAEAYA